MLVSIPSVSVHAWRASTLNKGLIVLLDHSTIKLLRSIPLAVGLRGLRWDWKTAKSFHSILFDRKVFKADYHRSLPLPGQLPWHSPVSEAGILELLRLGLTPSFWLTERRHWAMRRASASVYPLDQNIDQTMKNLNSAEARNNERGYHAGRPVDGTGGVVKSFTLESRKN